MKLEEWLATIPIQPTKKGARLDLRLYVYPDGHGNFSVDDDQGKLQRDSQPVGSPQEATQLLERIWSRAMRADVGSGEISTRPATIAERLGDLIGSVPDLPVDMAEQHDHYIHGTPKR